jgi:hypothetical protein
VDIKSHFFGIFIRYATNSQVELISVRKLFSLALATALSLMVTNSVQAFTLVQGFDNVTTLGAQGWVQQNNSNPLGTTDWFQGEPSIFASQSGTDNSYIAANFNSTADIGTISNWLLTPTLNFSNGDVLSFFTRTTDGLLPDRLEVRLSLNGASTDVGTSETSVGDFTTLLLTINQDLTTTDYPTDWTQFTVTISGLPIPTDGRLAFRYFVTDGGASGNNSNYIGIDSVSVESTASVPEPSELPGLLLLGGIGIVALRRKAAQTKNE